MPKNYTYNYKVREIGSSYGISVPRNVFQQFSGCSFNLTVENDKIIYTKKDSREEDNEF